MGWNFRNHNEKMISEINITPLTDVMLVLLVIFMVSTPLIMMESFKIILPKAITSDAEPGKGLILSISDKGEVFHNNKRLGMGELYPALKAELGSMREGQRIVIVKADGNARHSSIVSVLDIARDAGAERLSIATERQEPASPR